MGNPWDSGEKPLFVSENGYDFWIDTSTMKYLASRKIYDIAAFFAKKNDYEVRVLMNKNQEIIYESQKIEEIGARIDMIATARRFSHD